jgi:hypothetical protein
MKLEIKHLAGYLPYDLKVSDIDTLNYGTGIGGIDHILTTKNEKYKPRLIPLQKCYSWSSEMMAIKIDYPDKKKLERIAKGKIKLEDLPYRIIQICFKNHIDIFNLIPQGLAVEKN